MSRLTLCIPKKDGHLKGKIQLLDLQPTPTIDEESYLARVKILTGTSR